MLLSSVDIHHLLAVKNKRIVAAADRELSESLVAVTLVSSCLSQ